MRKKLSSVKFGYLRQISGSLRSYFRQCYTGGYSNDMYLRKIANPVWVLLILCSLAAAGNEEKDEEEEECTYMNGIDKQFITENVKFSNLNWVDGKGTPDDTKQRDNNQIIQVSVTAALTVVGAESKTIELKEYLKQYMFYRESKIALQLNFTNSEAFEKFIGVSAKHVARSLTFSKIPIILHVVAYTDIPEDNEDLRCYTLSLPNTTVISTWKQAIIYNFHSAETLLEDRVRFKLDDVNYARLNYSASDANLNMRKLKDFLNVEEEIVAKGRVNTQNDGLVEEALKQCLDTRTDFLTFFAQAQCDNKTEENVQEMAMKDLKWGNAQYMTPEDAHMFNVIVANNLNIGLIHHLRAFLKNLTLPATKGLAFIFDDLTVKSLNEALTIIGENDDKLNNIPIWIHLPVINDTSGVYLWEDKLDSVILPCYTVFYGWNKSDTRLTEEAFQKMKDKFPDGLYRIQANRVDNWADADKLGITDNNTVVVAHTKDLEDEANLKGFRSWPSRHKVSVDSDKFLNWVNMCVKHVPVPEDARKEQTFVTVKSDKDMDAVFQSSDTNKIMKVALEDEKDEEGNVVGVKVEGWASFDEFLEKLGTKTNAKLQLILPSAEALGAVESSKFDHLKGNITFILHFDVVTVTEDKIVEHVILGKEYFNLFNCFALSLGWTPDSTKYSYDDIKKYVPDHVERIFVVPEKYYKTFKKSLKDDENPTLAIYSNDTGPTDLSDIRETYNSTKYFWDVPEDYFNGLTGRCPRQQEHIFCCRLSELQWTAAKSKADIENFKKNEIGMISVDVTANNGDIQFAGVSSKDFASLLKPVEDREFTFGFKFVIPTTTVFEKFVDWATLSLDNIAIPIVVHANVVGAKNSVVDINMDDSKVVDLLTCRTLSIGYSGAIPQNGLEALTNYRKTINFDKVIYSVPITYLEELLALKISEEKDHKMVLKATNNEVLSTKLRQKLNEVNIFLDLEKKDRLDLVEGPKMNSYFNLRANLTKLAWIQSINDKPSLEKELNSNNKMIGMNVNLEGSNLVIGAAIKDGFKLTDALNLIESKIENESKKFGIQLLLANQPVVENIIRDDTIVATLQYIAAPVLIHGDIVAAKGAGQTGNIVDLTGLSGLLRNRALSLGWQWPIDTPRKIDVEDMNTMLAKIEDDKLLATAICIAFPLNMLQASLAELLVAEDAVSLQATWTTPSITNDKDDLIGYRDTFGRSNVARKLYLDVPASVITDIEKASAVGIGPASLVVLTTISVANLLWC